jgi:hypothetical protein
MSRRRIHTAILTILLVPFLRAVPALALGDKVVPHVVDGGQPNGIRYRTKFDICNLSYSPETGTLSKVTLLFFKEDGSPWAVSTKDQGTTSALQLNLAFLQTIRVETAGTGDIASGFAILRNLEPPQYLPDDNEVSITVYYEVLHGNDIIQTVSVPIGQPTVSWSFPVEIDKTITPNLLTGFAVVNLAGAANRVTIDLYSSNGVYATSASYTLSSTSPTTPKKLARFLDEPGFFPSIRTFKGMAFVQSQYPVAFLSLLQTPTPGGDVQYATLVPTYLDSLRHNTLMYLPQGYSLDADLPAVDYFHDETSDIDPYYETPWDLLFVTVSLTGRKLTPVYGATVSVIGNQNDVAFDNISIEDLSSRTYTSGSIDLGDGSGYLVSGFTFAIKTGLGHYVKVRVRGVIAYGDSTYRDLTLEVYVFK